MAQVPMATEADHTTGFHLGAAYAALDISPLTAQQEKYVLLRLRNVPIGRAAITAGYKDTRKAPEHHPSVQKVFQYFADVTTRTVAVTRDLLTTMLFEAHGHAATATEEISAIRELGKMHNLYEVDKEAQKITAENRLEKMRTLDTQALLDMSNDPRLGGSLVPESEVQSAEEPEYTETLYTEVKHGVSEEPSEEEIEEFSYDPEEDGV